MTVLLITREKQQSSLFLHPTPLSPLTLEPWSHEMLAWRLENKAVLRLELFSAWSPEEVNK